MHGILLRGSNVTQSSRQNTLKDFSRLDGVYFSLRISKDSSWIKPQKCLTVFYCLNVIVTLSGQN